MIISLHLLDSAIVSVAHNTVPFEVYVIIKYCMCIFNVHVYAYTLREPNITNLMNNNLI